MSKYVKNCLEDFFTVVLQNRKPLYSQIELDVPVHFYFDDLAFELFSEQEFSEFFAEGNILRSDKRSEFLEELFKRLGNVIRGMSKEKVFFHVLMTGLCVQVNESSNMNVTVYAIFNDDGQICPMIDKMAICRPSYGKGKQNG